MKINAVNNYHNNYSNKQQVFKANVFIGNRIINCIENQLKMDGLENAAIYITKCRLLDKIEQITRDIEPKAQKVFWDLKNNNGDTMVSIPLQNGDRRLAVDSVNLSDNDALEKLPKTIDKLLEFIR